MSITPFQVPRSAPDASDLTQADLNSYAGRGFPVTTPLSDIYVGGKGQHGVEWAGPFGNNIVTYVANAGNGTATATRAVAIDTLCAVPFLHDHQFLLSKMGVFVTTGAVGSGAVLGIYDSVDSAGGVTYPNRLLWNGTEFATTANNTVHEDTPNVDLEPGKMYWAVYHAKVLAPTISVLAVAGTNTLIGNASGAGGISFLTHVTVASTYSATLPATFPLTGLAVTTTPPAIYYELSPATGRVLSQARPVWAPREDGWVLRSARLLSSSAKQSGASSPNSVKVSIRLRTPAGYADLGSFDSRTAKMQAGTPFYLTGVGLTDTVIARDTVVEVYVEQRGWPLVTVNDMSVCWEFARAFA